MPPVPTHDSYLRSPTGIVKTSNPCLRKEMPSIPTIKQQSRASVSPAHFSPPPCATRQCPRPSDGRGIKGEGSSRERDGTTIRRPPGAIHRDDELAGEGKAREFHLQAFTPRIFLQRNAQVCFYGSLENKARSEDQACTSACTHRGLIIMLGGSHTSWPFSSRCSLPHHFLRWALGFTYVAVPSLHERVSR
jgi:hypothetical protein